MFRVEQEFQDEAFGYLWQAVTLIERGQWFVKYPEGGQYHSGGKVLPAESPPVPAAVPLRRAAAAPRDGSSSPLNVLALLSSSSSQGSSALLALQAGEGAGLLPSEVDSVLWLSWVEQLDTQPVALCDFQTLLLTC